MVFCATWIEGRYTGVEESETQGHVDLGVCVNLGI